jgi:DNA polymerase
VAWHRPDHDVLERAAPWFVERFSRIRWAILTPDRSAYWDLKELRFGRGIPLAGSPEEDELEQVWRTHYLAVFAPRA